jgi:PAS domain S-box-containing protein
MKPHLHVLIVEDSEDDMLLMLRELRQGGYALDYVRVDTAAAMQKALAEQPWDIVIADYSLPTFSGPEALKLIQNQGLDIPFIIVSGTIGEDTAVAALKAGAHDFMNKGRLARLVPAVERELREAEERRKRRSAEHALQRANDVLRNYADELEALYNHAPCGYHSLDREGTFIRINDTELKMLGYTRNELVGKKKFSDILTTESVRTFQTSFPLFQQQGWVRDLEFNLIRKDGTTLPVSLSATVVNDAAGEYLHSRSVVIDIAERKHVEENLRQSEQKFHAIFDGTFQFMGLLTTEGIVVEMNQTALDIIAADLADVIGQPFWLTPWWTYSAEQREKLQQAIISAASGEFVRFESQHIWADGTFAFVDFSLKPFFDAEGGVVMLIPEGRDITDRKRTEEELRNMEAQFLRAQRLESLGTLASGIAHDFNNILTPILAASQIIPLKLPNLDRQNLELLKLIEDSTKRGADLVKQILAFARGAEGKRVPLQVRHLLSEVLKVVRQTFPKTIRIATNIPNTDLWTVSADGTQLHQVFLNLCVNARDAMPDGGILKLEATNQLVDETYTRMSLDAHIGSYVAITVSDTGTGISAEFIDRIFDPFFTTKEQGKGTGLGLSTVLGIVKSHGGFVQVYSEVSNGSQFKVYLPAIADTEMPKEAEQTLFPGNEELILIVDDEPLIRQVAQTVLESHNYRTLLAGDGIEAIAAYAQHRREISIVLMDMMMPLMDGITAIRTLQKLNPTIKVIATSGLTSNAQLTEEPGIEVKAFLPKPYTAKELLDVLQKVLHMDNSVDNS